MRRLLYVSVIAVALLFVARAVALIPSVQDSLCREMSRSTYRGSVLGVAALLVAGANPNRSVHGSTPAIHAAAEKNDVRVLKLLLAFGADPNLRTKFEITPLWLARNMKAEGTGAILAAVGGFAYIDPNAP